MPLGEIAGEILFGLKRILGRILSEVAIEILIMVPGYFIAKFFFRLADPEEWHAIVFGIVFWSILLGSVHFGYNHFFPEPPAKSKHL